MSQQLIFNESIKSFDLNNNDIKKLLNKLNNLFKNLLKFIKRATIMFVCVK
jgi:hypothetical protein